MDAEAILGHALRPLVLGIGGGGDVVGALATAESMRLYNGAEPVVGGISWERQPIDPLPGPRTVAEIDGGRELAPGVLLAGPQTHVRANGVRFAESHMAEFLGEETVLIDPTLGPRQIAASLSHAADRLECDLIVFLDVGGDVLAHGDEPGLGSPLCDAILLATAVHLEAAGGNVLGAIFGPGCDGELTLSELSARLADLGRASGLAGARGMTPAVAARLEAAMAYVITEASAQAVRAFRGDVGPTAIRGGRRKLTLSSAGAVTIYFDPVVAFHSTAPLARAVAEASDLDQANRALAELGVRTELDGELIAGAEGFAAP